MAVRYYNDDCKYRLPQKRLTAEWLRRVAEEEGYVLGDVSYIFCSAQRLLEMNRQYLGHDYFTDVITFDYSDRSDTRIVSGDIFIDVETVADNARQYGATALQEMRRVVELAEEAGIRGSVKIMVGGAPISQSFCDEIGADVYTEDAAAAARAAVALCR